MLMTIATTVVVVAAAAAAAAAANRPFDPCSRMPPSVADVSRTTQNNNTKHGRNKKALCTLSLKRCPLPKVHCRRQKD